MKKITAFWLIDQKTEKISHTKFWSNTGYLILCLGFIWHTYTNTPVDINLWSVFALVVVGNRTIAKVIATRKGQPQE